MRGAYARARQTHDAIKLLALSTFEREARGKYIRQVLISGLHGKPVCQHESVVVRLLQQKIVKVADNMTSGPQELGLRVIFVGDGVVQDED